MGYAKLVILSLAFDSFFGLDNLYIRPLSEGVAIYGGLFNVNSYTQTFNIFIFILTTIILFLNAFHPRTLDDRPLPYSKDINLLDIGEKDNKAIPNFLLEDTKGKISKAIIIGKENFKIVEYPLIILFIVCGGIFLISSADLISLFLSIELQSYGLYILSTLYRDSESATASGLTYFLLGGLSSCFILLGSAILYANSGNTSLENLYVIFNISDINEHSIYWYQPYYLHISLIILTVGFLFKVSAAPFHIWSPNVYDGIPTIVTTYVAIIAKISIFAFLVNLVYYSANIFSSWGYILIISSVASLVIGSVLGLTQFRIKRLLAYSTISHVGFVLLALVINTVESIQSYIFYILQYSLTNLNAFIILIAIGYSLYFYTEKNYFSRNSHYLTLIDNVHSPLAFIKSLKGYFYINSFLALSLAITIFSFVGIPPIIGFFAKQMVLSAALDSGYVFISIIAILTSVIGAGYYLALIKEIFFFKDNLKVNPLINIFKFGVSDVKANVKPYSIYLHKTYINPFFATTISVCTLLLITFIATPEIWFNIVSILTIVIFKN